MKNQEEKVKQIRILIGLFFGSGIIENWKSSNKEMHDNGQNPDDLQE